MRKYIPSFIHEESEVIDALLSSIEDEITNLQNYIEQEVLGWFINTATGDELDRIGLLAGVLRGGKNDTDYRIEIKSKILSTAGTQEVLLNIAKDLTDDTAEVSDYAAGQVEVKANAEMLGVKVSKETFQEAINRVKVAGVQPYWHWRVFESTSESVNITEEVQDSHNYPLDTEVSENGAPSETVIDGLHSFPYVFDTDKFDFAEFS